MALDTDCASFAGTLVGLDLVSDADGAFGGETDGRDYCMGH